MHGIIVIMWISLLYFTVYSLSFNFDDQIDSEKYVKLKTLKTRKFIDTWETLDDPILEIREEEEKDDGNDNDNDRFLQFPLIEDRLLYMIDVEIGTPPQKLKVEIDTCSSDFWIPSSNTSVCLKNLNSLDDAKFVNAVIDETQKEEELTYSFPSDILVPTVTPLGSNTNGNAENTSFDCSVYGTFNSDESETFHLNDTTLEYEYISKALSNGIWGYDNISITGIMISNFSFAVTNDSSVPIGVMGIGMPTAESTYNISDETDGYMYENLPIKLKSNGLIDMVSYSIYLDEEDSSYANILFGAVDHTKYKGDLVSFSIINPEKSEYDAARFAFITLNSISFFDNETSNGATIFEGSIPALFDTSSSYTSLPSDFYDLITSLYDLHSYSGLKEKVFNCSDAYGQFLIFNFQGKDINIPISSFVLQLETSMGGLSDYCELTFNFMKEDFIIFGDDFIKNIYLVADLENEMIALAEASFDSPDDADLEILSTGIPVDSTPNESLLWSKSTSIGVLDSMVLTSISISTVTESSGNGGILTTMGGGGFVSTRSTTSSSGDAVEIKLSRYTLFSCVLTVLAFFY